MPLSANSLTRSFGSKQAVVDASIRIEPGNITALVGPNGSGKTTTMLMLVGLLAPTSGWVSVDDMIVASADRQHPTTISEAAKARRHIGWMPDEFGSWPFLQCLEVLEAFAGFYQLPNPHVRAREVLEEFGMEDLAKQRLLTLSRGQKQRLGLARTLLHEPKYLILDEPSNGMDPTARAELFQQLRELASRGRGILISSHVLKELNEIADDVVIMRKGTVIASQMDSRSRWRLEILNRDRWERFLKTTDISKWCVEPEKTVISGQGSSVRKQADPSGQIELTLRPRALTSKPKYRVTFCAEDEEDAASFVTQACAAGVSIIGMENLQHNLEQQYLESEDAPLSEERFND